MYILLTVTINIIVTYITWKWFSRKFEKSLLDEFEEYCNDRIGAIDAKWKS